jgi:hypothetical protein
MLCNYVVEGQCFTFDFVGLLMFGRASDIPKYYFRCILIVSYSRIKSIVRLQKFNAKNI